MHIEKKVKRNNISFFILASPLKFTVQLVLWRKGINSDKPVVMSLFKPQQRLEKCLAVTKR